MIKLHSLLILFFLTITSSSFSQKLKKADRMLVESIQSHIGFLSDKKLQGCAAGSEGERTADEYIIGQLQKNGLKPLGDSATWQQKFSIADGKAILRSSYFSINEKPLVLHADYFPFAFSVSKNVEASVSAALAEAGVPWFVELKELLDENEDSAHARDTSFLVGERAKRVQAKGATALVVYNNSIIRDIVYNGMDTMQGIRIPVIYLTHPAAKKHLSNETSTLDVKMNIAMEDRVKKTSNIIGLLDNRADSIIVVAAHLDSQKDVAALIELTKLLKSRQYRFSDYLFVVYPGERKGMDGITYFNQHPADRLKKVSHTVNLDTIDDTGLAQVKQCLNTINAFRGK